MDLLDVAPSDTLRVARAGSGAARSPAGFFGPATDPAALVYVRCVLGVCAAEAKSSTYVDNDGVVGGDEGIRDGELPAVYTGTGFAASPHVD